MGEFIGKRILQLIPILIGVSFLTFAMLYLAPGDPAQSKLLAQGAAISDEVIEKARVEMGLDKPFLIQYLDWAKNLLSGNMGISYHDNTFVSDKIGRAAGATIQLTVWSMIITLLISIPLGILTAVKQNTWVDGFIRFLTFVGTSMPNFMIALLLIYVFCLKLKLMPIVTSGGGIQGLILPVTTLVIMQSSKFIRQIRAEILEQMSAEYVLSARVRGVREWFVLIKNILHNSMITIITMVGLSVGTLLAGTAVIETIFSWPGLGKLVVDSITYRDYPVVQGFVVVIATVYVLINLLTDICYKILDPRVE